MPPRSPGHLADAWEQGHGVTVIDSEVWRRVAFSATLCGRGFVYRGKALDPAEVVIIEPYVRAADKSGTGPILAERDGVSTIRSEGPTLRDKLVNLRNRIANTAPHGLFSREVFLVHLDAMLRRAYPDPDIDDD